MNLFRKTLALYLMATLALVVPSDSQAGTRPDLSSPFAAVRAEMQRMADAQAVADAFLDALEDHHLATLAREEVTVQLWSNQILGYVNGYWAKPVNLVPIYAIPEIRKDMEASLTDTPSARERLADAVADWTNGGTGLDAGLGAGIVAIRDDLARQAGMTDILGIIESIGSGAFLDEISDLSQIGANDFAITGLIVSIVGSLIGGVLMGGCDDEDDRYSPEGDFDGDGIDNEHDADDDNDGTVDTKDKYPFDPDHDNTPCPPPGMCFATTDLADHNLALGIQEAINAFYSSLVQGADIHTFGFGREPGLSVVVPGF